MRQKSDLSGWYLRMIAIIATLSAGFGELNDFHLRDKVAFAGLASQALSR